MTRGKLAVVVIVVLITGYVAGFITRPLIVAVGTDRSTATPSLPNRANSDARSEQYFAAHLDEARQVVEDCREGTVRGDECANAERAVVAAESKDRFREFRSER